MLTSIVDVAVTIEQSRDDVNRLAEHLVADAYGRPAPSDDVLVEVLPGYEPETKATAGEDLHCGRLLRYDGRVVGNVGHRQSLSGESSTRRCVSPAMWVS